MGPVFGCVGSTSIALDKIGGLFCPQFLSEGEAVAIALPVEAWLAAFIPAGSVTPIRDGEAIAVSAEAWPVTLSVAGGLLMSSVGTSSVAPCASVCSITVSTAGRPVKDGGRNVDVGSRSIGDGEVLINDSLTLTLRAAGRRRLQYLQRRALGSIIVGTCLFSATASAFARRWIPQFTPSRWTAQS